MAIIKWILKTPPNDWKVNLYQLTTCFSSYWYVSSGRSGNTMEPIMNQIWPRVFQRLHRTAVFPRRSHSGCAEPTAVPASTSSRHIRPTLLVSRLYQPASLRDMRQDTLLKGEMTCKSQRLMQKAGLIHPSNPGCYYYLPATVRSMEKLVRRVFKE